MELNLGYLSLNELASRIRQEIEAAVAKSPGISRSLALGSEGQVNVGHCLLEARRRIKPGGYRWGNWLATFDMNYCSAKAYMEKAEQSDCAAREAERAREREKRREQWRTEWSWRPGPSHPGPAPNFPNLEELRARYEREQARLKEQRHYSLLIVDAGYKAMASKLHPDHGGSNEDMVKLTHARDALKSRL